MKRDAPHMGFSRHADLPSALSASRVFRERVRLPHPSITSADACGHPKRGPSADACGHL